MSTLMKMADPEEQVYEGCIYGEQPADPHFQLSVDSLRSMQLVGLPIRVEHADNQAGDFAPSGGSR
jgi:hypothetical protein